MLIKQDQYINIGQFFHWATQDHYKLWFKGTTNRHPRTERILPRLVRKGKLVSRDFGKKLVYAVPRMKNTPVYHGLGVTETIVRIHHSKPGVIIPERFFKGLGSVPDWGINYEGKLLLVEFSTQDNFEDPRVIKTKLTRYEDNLEKIEARFKAQPQTTVVLFVLDVSRERVKNFLLRNSPGEAYYFTDFGTFKEAPFGQQFTTPIYFWRDGKEYTLW